MRARSTLALLLTALSLTAAACDPDVARFDFVAVSEDGETLRGSFTLSLASASESGDPDTPLYPTRSAVVGGEPARGQVLVVNDSAGADGSQSPPRDGLFALLWVDSIPTPRTLSIVLSDPSGQAFASTAVPFPLPPLTAFGGGRSVSLSEGEVPMAVFTGDLISLEATRIFRPRPPGPLE